MKANGMDWKAEAQEVEQARSRLATARAAIKQERKALEGARQDVADLQEAQAVLQRLSQEVQHKVHARLAEVVTSCLHAVFDDPYDFKVHFDRKRGRTEVRFALERGGMEVDPMSASGGGVVDVAAFALRVACLMLHQPVLRKLLVLDEPFRFVSSHYQDNVRSMLEELSKQMDLQIVMVTHNHNLTTGKVIEIKNTQG